MSLSVRKKLGFDYRFIYSPEKLEFRGDFEINTYEEANVILKCSHDVICIKGEELELESADSDSIHISGKITEILFS